MAAVNFSDSEKAMLRKALSQLATLQAQRAARMPEFKEVVDREIAAIQAVSVKVSAL